MAPEGDKMKLEQIKNTITKYPDFPKPGILFRDIFPVLSSPTIFDDLINIMISTINSKAPKANVIAGIESRGFLFGPIIANKLNLAFIPIRKAGKLPGPTCNVKYDLEYGEDTLQIQSNSIQSNDNVVIVDDLLATGGTIKASCDLIHLAKGIVSLVLAIIELVDLNGRKQVNAPLETLIKF